MKNPTLPLIMFLAICFGSCEKEGPYEDYLVAKPILVNINQFMANTVQILDPVPLQTSGKIYAYGNYIFVNDVNQGFHVIDNQNPHSPENIAFIKLEGNNDISIKNDKLFADSYGDLVVLDISNMEDIKIEKRLVNAIYDNGFYMAEDVVYPEAQIYDTSFDHTKFALVGWNVVTERRPVSDFETHNGGFPYAWFGFSENFTSTPSHDQVGQGGSMARFKIVGNYLYVIDYSTINIFDISNLDAPKAMGEVEVGWDIETIYNQNDILFIGGRQGMYLYNITNPVKPTLISEFRHGTACDPVVVDGNFAYVTLQGGGFCGNTESGLYVIDISDLTNPLLKVIYPLEGPYGLGIKGDQLFVCDGQAGLKVFDKSEAPNLTQIDHFDEIFAYDVIPLQTSLLMIGDKVLRQYNYASNTIDLISQLELH